MPSSSLGPRVDLTAALLMLVSILSCAGVTPVTPVVEPGVRLSVAHRPMTLEGSQGLQGVRVGGRVIVRLGVDTSGHVRQETIEVRESPDSALSELAKEITRRVVFDPKAVLPIGHGELIDLPFVFLMFRDGTPLTPLGGESEATPGFVYVLMRADSTSPLTGEALVKLPERVSGPPPRYPQALQMAHVSGDVMVEGIIDTLGHVERGSVRVVSSTDHGFDDSAMRTVAGSVFRAARTPWRAVRVRVRIPISYRTRR